MKNTMSAWTPGPWRVELTMPKSPHINVIAGENTTIALPFYSRSQGMTREQYEANAALIARAPAMAEALRNIGGRETLVGLSREDLFDLFIELRTIARAALPAERDEKP